MIMMTMMNFSVFAVPSQLINRSGGWQVIEIFTSEVIVQAGSLPYLLLFNLFLRGHARFYSPDCTTLKPQVPVLSFICE